MQNDCLEQPLYSSRQHFLEKGEQTEVVCVGDYVACEIVEAGKGTHLVKPLYKTSLQEYTRTIPK